MCENIRVRETYSEAKSIAELVDMADEMWNHVKQMNTKDSILIFNELVKKYKDFCSAYNIIIQFMAQGIYNTEVFARYLNYIQNKMRSEDEYFDGLAYYFCGLKKLSNPKMNSREVKKFKHTIIQTLKNESETFKKNIDRAERELETLVIENRNELKQFCLDADISKAEYIRIDKSNIDTTCKWDLSSNVTEDIHGLTYDDLLNDS